MPYCKIAKNFVATTGKFENPSTVLIKMRDDCPSDCFPLVVVNGPIVGFFYAIVAVVRFSLVGFDNTIFSRSSTFVSRRDSKSLFRPLPFFLSN